jgi:hypothetical protein
VSGAIAPKVNIAGLDPDFVRRLNQAYQEAPEAVKKRWGMISGFRPTTRAEARALGMDPSSSQEDIWERSGHGTKFAAAPPGSSRHQQGRAADFNTETADYLRRVGGRYGLTGLYNKRGGVFDRPHIQMIEQLERNAANKRASARAALARAGQDNTYALEGKAPNGKAKVDINVRKPKGQNKSPREEFKNPTVKIEKTGQMGSAGNNATDSANQYAEE